MLISRSFAPFLTAALAHSPAVALPPMPDIEAMSRVSAALLVAGK